MPEATYINVTPHPRILGVLGDIEFAAWQCLAELVDNAFDEFQSSPEEVGSRPTVSISLPTAQDTRANAEVIVQDNGRGMSLDAVRNAISAGWTGNGRHGALGLFGMGFNIATARLGRKTTVRTGRAGDPFWTEVTLDLPEIEASAEYRAPYRQVPKGSPSEHGTTVTISDLKGEQFEALRRANALKVIREKLSDVYSYLLTERGFLLTINGRKLPPRKPCLWDEKRTVTRHGVEISAVQKIDVPLSDKKACMACGYWNPLDVDRCRECDQERLEVRPRRIWGWLGVQRYVHSSDYGIDFLRNGRKILLKDKRVFYWTDEDGLGEPEKEYPIDSKASTGRIVGEIHCDHVTPNYQKTAFEFETAEWHQVLRAIRGESPLRPEIAKRRQLPENRSPLALLYTGFRRQDAGLKYLVPGNGKDAIHEKTITWAKLFRDGHPDYQTDDIWYEAAYSHDNPAQAEPEPEPDDDASPLLPGLDLVPTGEGIDSETTDPATAPAPEDPEPVETFEKRLQRYRDHADQLPDLAGEYMIPDLGRVELKVWAVREQRLSNAKDQETPAFSVMLRAPLLEVFVDSDHQLYREHGADMRDVALLEAAEYMRVKRGGPSAPLAQLLLLFKERSSSPRLTPTAMADEAERLLERIRTLMVPVIAETPAVHWLQLRADEREAAEERFALEADPGLDWNEAVNNGDFIRFAPASAVLRVINESPALFMDGKVFRRSYTALSASDARDLVVERLMNPLSDLALLAQHRPKITPEELARIRVSCRLITRDLADDS
ncbi:ATP-binding protein [Streptomyces gobitricini]|uniref:Histidine kinase/HSP90-like ATPase domain-containing protein n=1 Tax=Streptomyces gobitricini TaxID=68211 RepID=A0ABN3MSP9_9ACTN